MSSGTPGSLAYRKRRPLNTNNSHHTLRDRGARIIVLGPGSGRMFWKPTRCAGAPGGERCLSTSARETYDVRPQVGIYGGTLAGCVAVSGGAGPKGIVFTRVEREEAGETLPVMSSGATLLSSIQLSFSPPHLVLCCNLKALDRNSIKINKHFIMTLTDQGCRGRRHLTGRTTPRSGDVVRRRPW